MHRHPSRLTLSPLEDRLTPTAAGTLDPTFGAGGVAPLVQPPGTTTLSPTAEAVSPDGRVAVLATTAGLGSGGYQRVAERFTTDGRPDPSFGNGGVGPLPAYAALASTPAQSALAFDRAGGLLVGADGPSGLTLLRLTPGGEPDTSFGDTPYGSPGTGNASAVGPNGGPAPITYPVLIAVQPDGSILAAGADLSVARFTAAGRADPAFGSRGQVRQPDGTMRTALAAAVAPDGGVVFAGSLTVDYQRAAEAGGQFAPTYNPLVVRLRADGTPDPAFGSGGQFSIGDRNASAVATGVRVLPDGSLVVAAASGTNAFAFKLTPAGQLDTTYGNGGRVDVADARVAGLLPDGRAVFAASNADGTATATRFTAAGQPEASFRAATFPTGVRGIDPATTIGAGSTLTLLTGGTSPALVRVIGTDSPFPVAPGSVTVGGPLNGGVSQLQPAADGALQPAPAPVTVYPNFPGDARTATADVNGDGVPDIVTGPGPGGGPNVVVTDGKTGAVIANFLAFESTFTGGVFVAAADLNGDGKAEVVVTPDQGGGPVVVIYDGARLSQGANASAELVRFLGIADDAFRGGARPALGDVNGDGRPDLVVAAGFGGGPRVAVFDGSAVTDPSRLARAVVGYTTAQPDPAHPGAPIPFRLTGDTATAIYSTPQPPKLVGDFFVFEPTLRNGVFVAAGDLTGDGKAELVVGGGPGGGPRVTALDGQQLLANQQVPVANFFAGDPASRGGVRVAVQPGADGLPRLVTGSGAGEAGRVSVYKAATARAGGAADQTLSPFGDGVLADGVYVG